MRAFPGDVVTGLTGFCEKYSAERMAELRRILGVDLPISVQVGQRRGAAEGGG